MTTSFRPNPHAMRSGDALTVNVQFPGGDIRQVSAHYELEAASSFAGMSGFATPRLGSMIPVPDDKHGYRFEAVLGGSGFDYVAVEDRD